MDKRNKRFRKRKLLKTEFKLQKFVLPSISLKNSIFLLYPSEAQKCPVTAGQTRVHSLGCRKHWAENTSTHCSKQHSTAILFEPYPAVWEINKHMDQKCRGCSFLLLQTAQGNSFLVLNNVKQPPQPITPKIWARM